MRALALAVAALVSLVSERARAYQERGSERVDYTAYTLKPRELSLGPLKSQFGIIRELTVGTYVPTWFAFPWLKVPVPTGFFKVRDPFRSKLTLSLRGNFVYIDGDALASRFTQNSGNSADLFVLPLEAAASYHFDRRFTQSLDATYVAVLGSGGEQSDASIRGAAALTNLTLGSFSEWRLGRVVALTLLMRVMVYRGNVRLHTHFTQGSTEVDAELGASKPYRGLVACAVPGLSFSFAHLNFQLGLGYGNWWLPIVQLPLPEKGLVPEADVSIRF